MESGKGSLKERAVHLRMKMTSKAFAFVVSRNAFFAVITVLMLIVGIAGGIAFTCRPQFCGFCHTMDPQIKSWKVSTHRNVNCISCHVEPGLGNLLIDKLKAGKSLYYQVFGGYENPINKESKLAEHLSNESCLQCHSMSKETTPQKGLIMNHEAHEKVGLRCAQCHNRLAHELKGYENNLNMEYCRESCHNGKVVKGDCEVCHTESFLKDKPQAMTGEKVSGEEETGSEEKPSVEEEEH